MKRIMLMAAVVAASMCLWAQDKVLMTIDGENIYASEFKYIYLKNNQETQIDQKSVDEYLDLFVNFKLKVKEAEQMGLDTTASFAKELDGYRRQAIPRYMTDTTKENELMQIAYERMKEDRRVSHICVKCAPNVSAEEEAAALKKIENARQRVTTGLTKKKGKKIITMPVEDFAKVADEVSEDPSVKENHGMIGWVLPFRFVYEFENAAYNTKEGEVSSVFRTPFGLHILKVDEVVQHKEIRAAHIMKMVPRGNDSIAEVAANEINEIYQKVTSGADFAKTAEEMSDDKGTAVRGGELNWFSRGMMVPEFEQAAFALSAKDSVSMPVKSMYGWHIIKYMGERELGGYDDMKDGIHRQVLRDSRKEDIEKSFVEKLKVQYDFKELDETSLNDFIVIAKKKDLTDSMYNAAVVGLNKPMFVYGSTVETQHDFATFMTYESIKDAANKEKAVKDRYTAYVAKQLMAYKDSQLEKEEPALRNLVTEYHDGILLFEVSLKEVWDKAGQDTAGLTAYFNANKDKYAWEKPHFKGYVIYCRDKATLKAAKGLVKHCDADSISSYLNRRLNIDTVPSVRFEKRLWELGQDSVVDALAFKKGKFAGVEDFPYAFAWGKKLKVPETYMDERAKVTQDYQEYLEKEWVKSLREKHDWKVDSEVFDAIKEELSLGD